MGVLEFAEMILRRFGGLSGLDRVTFDQLRQVKGIGEAKAAELIAAIEFGKRIHEATANRESRQIRSAEELLDSVRVKGGIRSYIRGKCPKNMDVLIPKSTDKAVLDTRIKINKNLKAPIKKRAAYRK